MHGQNRFFPATSALIAALIFAAGCGSEPELSKARPRTPKLDLDARVAPDSIRAMRLDVPFKAQVPPGVWKTTGNCNPACFAMIYSHHRGTSPTAAMIREFNDWALANSGKEHRNYNGTKTGYSFGEMKKFAQYKGLPPAHTIKANLPILIGKLEDGIPCVVSVKRRLDERVETRHAMLVVGIDREHIITHDPGRSAGKYLKYPLEKFLKVWRGGDNVMFYVEKGD